MTAGSQAVKKSLNFLKSDAEDAVAQWTDGNPFKSVLQRSNKTLSDLEKTFSPKDSESEWEKQYNGEGDIESGIAARRQIAFLRASMKEFHEEYDENVTDVDYMRLLEIPFTDSKYVIDYSIGEMGDD